MKATVEGGVMMGTQTATADIYRNIPTPPRRSAPCAAPPAKVVPWTGERDGTKAGVSCMQTMRADGAPNVGSANGPMSEDCLQLNVFTPKGAKKAPVMVWLHGGLHLWRGLDL
uniref:Carboxylesterase family protein n=1 Tax=Phenylobacterium glaciei TaxID=2803784 RepID=A0A974P3V3_9CAUL|nr:carboxylesterase family protein [Phenylobacterium glaciei]